MNIQERSLGLKPQHITPLTCTLRRQMPQQTRDTKEGDNSSIATCMETEGRKKENSGNKNRKFSYFYENYELSISRAQDIKKHIAWRGRHGTY